MFNDEICKEALDILAFFEDAVVEINNQENKRSYYLETHGGVYLLQREVDYILCNYRYKVGKSDNILFRLHTEPSFQNAYIKLHRYVNDPLQSE